MRVKTSNYIAAQKPEKHAPTPSLPGEPAKTRNDVPTAKLRDYSCPFGAPTSDARACIPGQSPPGNSAETRAAPVSARRPAIMSLTKGGR